MYNCTWRTMCIITSSFPPGLATTGGLARSQHWVGFEVNFKFINQYQPPRVYIQPLSDCSRTHHKSLFLYFSCLLSTLTLFTIGIRKNQVRPTSTGVWVCFGGVCESTFRISNAGCTAFVVDLYCITMLSQPFSRCWCRLKMALVLLRMVGFCW